MSKRGAHKKIHQRLRREHPEAVKKAEKIFRFKYPKLLILTISIVLAYALFSDIEFTNKIPLTSTGYLTTFIGGILIAFGFTIPFGVGLLINSSPQNLVIGALVAGLGATLSDLLIFKFIKFSFMNEFKEIEKTKTMKKIKEIVTKNKHILIRHYLIYVFVGIIIATPLPDEIGVSMLAGLTTINAKKLAIISFILHSLFIFLILYLGVYL